MKHTMIATMAAGMLAVPAPAPASRLELSYMADAGYASAVKLDCDPAGGAHPTPAKACNELKRVGGKPGHLKPAHTMCMMIYAPITAGITGTWKGKKITWTKQFGNSCEMTRATGVLFKF
jgi:hypothetical protein